MGKREIRVEVMGSSGETWDGPRSPSGNVVLVGNDWSGIIRSLKDLSFSERDTDADEGQILERFMSWAGAALAINFHMPDNLGLESKALAFFRVMEDMGRVQIVIREEEGGNGG